MPSRVKPHPATADDSYKRGLKHARSIMVEATADITDPDSVTVLAKAFIILNREIAAVTGRVEGGERIDYLAMVQRKARDEWRSGGGFDEVDGAAVVTTPIGRLSCEARFGDDGWASTYYLNGERIAVREIKALGLAQRPTTRNRRKTS